MSWKLFEVQHSWAKSDGSTGTKLYAIAAQNAQDAIVLGLECTRQDVNTELFASTPEGQEPPAPIEEFILGGCSPVRSIDHVVIPIGEECSPIEEEAAELVEESPSPAPGPAAPKPSGSSLA